MQKRFFLPYVGTNYQKGIQGKRVLVVGASFYCDKHDCPYFSRCTDVNRKDSSEFDTICPAYQPSGACLHDEPSYAIGDALQTYQRFASFMSAKVGAREYAEVWSYMAFTNYIQFFLPARQGRFRETLSSDLSERDFEAFIETISELQPHIVVIWGCVFNSKVREQNPYLLDPTELQRTESYVWHLRVPHVAHAVAMVNPYHPSSSAWYGNIDNFDKYLTKLLGE